MQHHQRHRGRNQLQAVPVDLKAALHRRLGVCVAAAHRHGTCWTALLLVHVHQRPGRR